MFEPSYSPPSAPRRLERLLKWGIVAGLVALAASSGWFFVAKSPVFPVVALLALALGAWLVSSPFAMLVGFLAVLFVRPAELFPALEALKLGKLSMLGAVGYFVLSRLFLRRVQPAPTSFNVLMVWLAVAVWVSGQVGIGRALSDAVFTDVFVKILLLFFLIVHLLDSPRRALQFQLVLSGLTGFIAAYTLWAKSTGTALIEGTRAAGVGMHGDPNDTALVLLMGAPFLIAATLETRGLRRFGLGLLLVLVLAGIVSTQSRGGFLGLGAGVFVLMRHRFKSRAARVSLVAVLVLGMAAVGLKGRATTAGGGVDESAQGRLVAWKAGMRMFRARPLTGMGLSTFGMAFPAYAEALPFEKKSMTAHNSYVLCLAEVGLFGTTPFVLLVVGTLVVSLRVSRGAATAPPSLERALRLGFAGNAAAVLTASFFLSQTWMWFLYILFAQAAALGVLYGVPFRPGAALLRLFAPRVGRLPAPLPEAGPRWPVGIAASLPVYSRTASREQKITDFTEPPPRSVHWSTAPRGAGLGQGQVRPHLKVPSG